MAPDSPSPPARRPLLSLKRKPAPVVDSVPALLPEPTDQAKVATQAPAPERPDRAEHARHQAERAERNRAKALAALEVLRNHYPLAFQVDPVRPLAIGSAQALARDRQAGRLPLSEQALKLAMAHWCQQPAYLQALVTGGPRLRLDGSEADPVSEPDQGRAAERLARRRPRAQNLS